MALYQTLSQDQRDFLANTANTGLNLGPTLNLRDEQGLIGLLVNWVLNHDNQIVWTPAAVSPAMGVRSATCYLAVESLNGFLDFFNQTSLVTATLAGGTATGKALNGGTAPVILSFVDGIASVLVSGTSTGTVLVTLSAPTPAGLIVTSELTLTLS